MIEIQNNDIERGGEKIGYIEDGYIYNESGKKLGYFENDYIYDANGDKLGYIEGEYIWVLGDGSKIRIEDNLNEVSGSNASDITRAAVRLLLG